ncbi:MAG: type II secretion system protein [Planctomycetota bacterium]
MKRKALTLVELLAVIMVVALLIGTLMPALRGSRQTAVRLVCHTNLTGIGRAMAAFAEDHDGDFPRAGLPHQMWSTFGTLGPTSWYREDMSLAFRFGPTVTSSMYLLVKYYKVPPKQFNCKGDDGVLEFSTDIDMTGPPMASPWSLLTFWDFGGGRTLGPMQWPMPGEFCSYAYHMPYKVSRYEEAMSFPISDLSAPGSPVCADRNPFLDKNAVDPSVGANSASHLGKGQNVLYKNLSVVFEKVPTVGLNEDNIYTYASGPIGDPIGTAPVTNGDGAPYGYQDAYLVGEMNHR